MTVLTYQINGNDVIMILQGHADYSESGDDIVCAAISTLTYTWINQLEVLKKDGIVKKSEYMEDDGRVEIRFQCDMEKIKYAFETIMTGFLMIEQNYFANFRVIRGEIENPYPI